MPLLFAHFKSQFTDFKSVLLLCDQEMLVFTSVSKAVSVYSEYNYIGMQI